MPTVDYTIRWTGQFEAPASGEVQFAVSSNSAANLYINGKRIRPPGVVKNLVAGKRYEIRVDYYQNRGRAMCKLLWDVAGNGQLQPVPADALYPTVAVPEAGAFALAGDPRGPTPAARGVLLVDGSFVPGTADSADDQTLMLSAATANPSNSPAPASPASTSVQSAHPSPESFHSPREPAFSTVAGDFAAGELQTLTDGKVRLSSVVLGEASFDTATQAVAAVLREVQPSGRWIIRTTTGGSLHANAFRVEGQTLTLDEPLIGALSLKLTDVTDITAADAQSPLVMPSPRISIQLSRSFGTPMLALTSHRRLVLAALLCAGTLPARAHPESISTLRLVLGRQTIWATLALPIRDLTRWFPPGRYTNYAAEVSRELQATAADLFELRVDGQAVAAARSAARPGSPGFILVEIDFPSGPHPNP